MPVTIKLSKTFYDQFGHEAADELVGVLNQVDAASQNSLREFNELNFARFDAKLEQRAAGLEAKIDRRTAELDAKIDQRFAELEARIDQRIGELRGELRESIGLLRMEMANLAVQLKDQQLNQMRWMVGMWGMIFLAVIGLWVQR